jgi:hypothetical protein
MTTLQYFLDQQSELQGKMPSPHPINLFLNAFDSPEFALLDEEGNYENTDEDRKPLIDFLHWNVTALTDELHELLGEIGWKPWAKSRHINLEAAQGEAIDALHFLLNIFLGLGMDAESVKLAYDNKHKKNEKRQEEGYDGVSTKCPGCKRALDDAAVFCYMYEGEEHENLLRSYPMSAEGTRFFHCSVTDGLYKAVQA